MNQNGGSRTETLVKLVLIVVISLLAFSVGTFVGKQFSDSQYKLATLNQEYSGKTPAVTKTASTNTLTDEDIASLTKEFIDNEREIANTETTVAKKPVDPKKDMAEKVAMAEKVVEKATPEVEKRQPASHQSKTKMKDDAISKAANRIAKDLSPTEAVNAKNRAPNALPPLTAATTVGKYTVQIASYSTQKEAEAHAGKLKAKGFEAFYLKAMIKGKPWYRVSVGLFGTRNSAKGYRAKLMKEANISAAIVQRIVK